MGFLDLAKECQKRGSRRSLDIFHPGQKRVYFARNEYGELYRRISYSAHRRWGKTMGAMRYVTWRALNAKEWMREAGLNPHRYHAAYIERYRATAKDKVWVPFKDLDHELNLGCHFNNADLIVTFPNGGYFRLYGADDPRFSEDIRGHYWDDVVIDEAQGFMFVDLKDLWERSLSPALAENRGRVFLIGTPGDNETFFHQIHTRGHKMWFVPEVVPFENPYTADALKMELEEHKEGNPNALSLPWIQREYFGKWVADNRRVVIQVSPEINFWKEGEFDPLDPGLRWFLGIDLGVDAESAYVVACENRQKGPQLTYVDCYTAVGMRIRDHAAKIKEFQNKYPGITIVADAGGLGKAVTEELRHAYSLPVMDAEKKNKRAYIERLNSWATVGLVKIYNQKNPQKPADSPIYQQWMKCTKIYTRKSVLQKDEDDWTESNPHHIHDAALYASKLATAPSFYREQHQEIETEGQRMRRIRIQNRRQRLF